MSSQICINHPTTIFGHNVQKTKKEWEEEEMEPDYGCVCNDLMILEWIGGHPIASSLLRLSKPMIIRVTGSPRV